MAQIRDKQREEREILRDQARHQRKIGMNMVMSPRELEALLDRIDELEDALANVRLLEQLPTEDERCRVVCHPAFKIRRRQDYDNGTVSIIVEKKAA
jgi:hypothetical protein